MNTDVQPAKAAPGQSSTSALRNAKRSTIFYRVAMVLAIAAVADAGDLLSISLPLGPFGASCMLVFGFSDLPFSPPRNLLFGHLLNSLVCLTLAMGSTIALMGPGTRQPAGASCSVRH